MLFHTSVEGGGPPSHQKLPGVSNKPATSTLNYMCRTPYNLYVVLARNGPSVAPRGRLVCNTEY